MLDTSVALPNFKGVSSITIKGTDLEKGEIQFGGQSYHYIGLPALYAAIFSEDQENYECAMDKAFKKLKLTSQVYYGKLNSFESDSSIPSDCRNRYNSARGRIDSLSATAPATASLINFIESTGFIEETKEDNAELIKSSFPPIY